MREIGPITMQITLFAAGRKLDQLKARIERSTTKKKQISATRVKLLLNCRLFNNHLTQLMTDCSLYLYLARAAMNNWATCICVVVVVFCLTHLHSVCSFIALCILWFVAANAAFSDPFPVKYEVRQGSVLSPILYAIYLNLQFAPSSQDLTLYLTPLRSILLTLARWRDRMPRFLLLLDVCTVCSMSNKRCYAWTSYWPGSTWRNVYSFIGALIAVATVRWIRYDDGDEVVLRRQSPANDRHPAGRPHRVCLRNCRWRQT